MTLSRGISSAAIHPQSTPLGHIMAYIGLPCSSCHKVKISSENTFLRSIIRSSARICAAIATGVVPAMAAAAGVAGAAASGGGDAVAAALAGKWECLTFRYQTYKFLRT